jgi:hypothetical protein
MNIKIKYLSIIFVLAVSFFPNSVFAETSPSQCPTSNPSGTVDCVSGKHYAGGQCRLDTEIQATITVCQESGKNETYSCSSNSCVCATGFLIDCRSVTPTPASCIASAMPTNPTCTAANKTTDQCGQCGGCVSGYSLSGGVCVQNCTGLNEIKAADGTCMSLEKVSKIMVKVFGLSALSDLMNGFQTLIDNITANPSYYLLTAQGTGTTAFTGQRLYQFGSGGDAANKIRLEADWADEAYLAQNLNWDNIPAAIANLFQNLAGVTFCDVNADCATGTCINGICSGTVALGGACNDTTLFCASPLVCTNGTCQNASNRVDPSDITPGINGQVLTTVSGAAAWAAAGAGGVTWSGFTALTYNGARTNYAAANGLCNSNFSGSHVCTSEEILSMIKSGVTLPADSTKAWVNSGPPGYTAAQANDCAGWTTADSASFGRYWLFSANSSGWLANCSSTYKFACCK